MTAQIKSTKTHLMRLIEIQQRAFFMRFINACNVASPQASIDAPKAMT